MGGPAASRWGRPGRSIPIVAVCLLLAAILISVSACGESKDLPNIENTAPEILSLVPEQEMVAQGEAIDITCTAEDEQLDAMSYIWSADVGEFFGTRDEAEISWRAPVDYEGPAVVTVVATDGKDESAPESVTLQVVGERGTLSGTVTQSGIEKPLEGATVSVQGLSAQTGADGAYTIGNIPIGNYTVEATLEGYGPSSRQFEIKDGPNTLNFSLTRTEDTGFVVGTVTNSLGAPVEGATCRIVGASLETLSDASGNYSLGPIAHGSLTLQISRLGYVNFSGTRQLDGAELRVDVTLVSDAPGQPTNVVATKSGLTMTVTWEPPIEDTTNGYQVYWRVDSNQTTALPGGRLGRNTTQVVVQGESDRRYRYFVAAINIDGVEGSNLGFSNDLVLTALSPWVEIPSGSVVVGDAVPGQSTERAAPHPANPIEVPAFGIEQTEVTNQQFYMFLWEARSTGFVEVSGGTVREAGHNLIFFNASKVKLDGDTFTLQSEFANHPVVGVTWYGAEAFARFYGRRLPAEVEWERVARGESSASGVYPGTSVGYGTRYPWGNEAPTTTLANFGGNYPATRAVRSLPAGATVHWGEPVYELSGNAWEWCQDWFGAYQSPHSPPGTGTTKVLRGGSHTDDATRLSVWARFSGDPTTSSPGTGFRCAKQAGLRSGE